MMLFIRDVPKNVSRKELKDRVQEALQPRIRLPFLDGPTVTKAQFLVIHDKDTGGTERHGLVAVQGGRKIDSVLQKVRRVRLKDRICTVRPYVKRRNQQRVATQPNQRTGNRRRPNIDAEIERKPYILG